VHRQDPEEVNFRFLAENCVDMICRVGPDLIMHYVSPSCRQLLNWTPAEMCGKGPDAFVLPEDLSIVAAAHARLIANGVDDSPTTVRMRKKDGTFAWMEIYARLVRSPETGRPTDIVLTMRDITQRKLREEEPPALMGAHGVPRSTDKPTLDSNPQPAWKHELRESEDRFSKAFGLTPVPMTLEATDSRLILDVNDAFTAITGYSPEEVVGRDAAALDLPGDPATRDRIRQLLGSGNSVRNVESRIKTRNGVLIDCLVSVERVSIHGQLCILSVLQDITERKRSELDLKAAIEAVMQDTSWFTRNILERLAQIRRPHRTAKIERELADLTPREFEVLGLMSQGLGDDDTSRTLELSRNTVRNHVTMIYNKIGVHRRGAAIVWARERGVVGYEPPTQPNRRGRSPYPRKSTR
jgi:PAS domain S-box-containing protein